MTNNMEQYNPKNPDEFKQENLEPPVPEPLNIIPVPDGSVVDKGSLSSPNYRKGQVGWRLRSDGGFEDTDGVFTGEITALSGIIGGFTIGQTDIVGGDLTLDSSGFIIMVQSIGNLKISSSGIEFRVTTATNAAIRLYSGSNPVAAGVDMRFSVGGLAGNAAEISLVYTAANTGKLIAVDTIDIGDASNYFNEINYKTLTDRGCLGFFDEGVEMQDGSKLSDVEALKAIKKSDTEMSVHGVPMLDYKTMPKVMYKPAPIAEEDVYDTKDKEKLLWKKGEKMGHDGAETTSLISIMLGAIKELSAKNDDLQLQINNLKK